MAAVHVGNQLLQQTDSLQVLVATVFVGDPLALLAGVVEIEHGSDSVHPQAVGMILVEPEQRAGDEEAPHFIAAVVKDMRTPLGMEALARVGMFVEMGAIKVGKPVL